MFEYQTRKPFADAMVAKFKQLLPPGEHRDCTVLRVVHELRYDNFPEWKITPENFDRIWKKIDQKKYPNEVRPIIYGKVSRDAKLQTIKSITPQELGIPVIDNAFDPADAQARAAAIAQNQFQSQLGVLDEHRAFQESSKKWTDKYLRKTTANMLKDGGKFGLMDEVKEQSDRPQFTDFQTKFLQAQANRVFVELQERFGATYQQAAKFLENTRMAVLEGKIDDIHKYFGRFPEKMLTMLCTADMNDMEKERAQHFIQNS